MSHNHYDHMDVPTLRGLVERDAPIIVVGLANGRFLQREGLSGTKELDWWQSTVVRGVSITSVPARHFSARGPGDRDRALSSPQRLRAPDVSLPTQGAGVLLGTK